MTFFQLSSPLPPSPPSKPSFVHLPCHRWSSVLCIFSRKKLISFRYHPQMVSPKSLPWGAGADRPWWHPPGGYTQMKFKNNVVEFRNNSGQTRSDSYKMSSLCRRRWLKSVVSFFSGKIGMTPSVAIQGDTNRSDANERRTTHIAVSVERSLGTHITAKLTIKSALVGTQPVTSTARRRNKDS